MSPLHIFSASPLRLPLMFCLPPARRDQLVLFRFLSSSMTPLPSIYMRHSTASRIPTLPTEVIEEVIDQAGDDPLSLRDLSLLCRPLLTRARIHLFTAIVIRNVEQMNSSREFFDLSPWVLPLVRTVTLAVNIPDDYNKPNIPLLDIFRVHLLTQLSNLRAWGLRTEQPGYYGPRLSLHCSVLLCYRTYGSHIQNLEIANIYIQDVSHFVRLISAFTNLRSLSCSTVWLRMEHQTPLHDAQTLRKLAKPLKMQHLSVSIVTTHYAMYWSGGLTT